MPLDKQSLLFLRLEGLAVVIGAAFLYSKMDASWLFFAILFLAPDLALLGYLGGSRLGAWCYNLVHTYVGPLALLMVGIACDSKAGGKVAVIWLAHIGFDRFLGYGLKTTERFGFTHLGRIGKDKPSSDSGSPKELLDD